MAGSKEKDPASAIPLTPASFHIMLALLQGAAHGYRIMQQVETLTRGQLRLGPGTLYRSIQKMQIDGLIEEFREVTDSADDDERRRYYKLTDFGKRVAQAEAARLEIVVEAAREQGLLAKGRLPGARRKS